eukprot:1127863_1
MAQSSEPAGWSLSKHLVSLLRVNENGWNVSLFQKQNIVDTALCGNCNEVCRGAVELGCDHDDKEIVLFCNSCLKDLISTNDNKCPINQHLDPIVSPVRSLRRQILQSSVICPYSVEYKRRNKNANIDNQVVMDTIGGDQKEGAPVAAASDEIIDGCTEWKGTLDALLKSDHLRQCTLKYDATGVQKLQMEEMKNENQSLQQIIQQQKQTIEAYAKDNQRLKQQLETKTRAIMDLEAQNMTQQQMIQELHTNDQDTEHLRRQLRELEAERVNHQEQIKSLHTNIQDMQRVKQQSEAKKRTQRQMRNININDTDDQKDTTQERNKRIPNLIVNRNETKVLQSDAIHRFDEVLVKANGTLTTTPWNGTNGGKLRLQIQTLVIESNATIDLNGLGYKGGKAKQKEVNGTAFTGESVNSPSECKTNANKGGGGGGSGSGWSGSTGGGGGGYGTKGSDSGGKGGDIYGDSKVTNLYLGSGGGSGHPSGSCDGKCGGNGGGALKITAQKIIIKNKGSISCNGHNAPSVNNALDVSGGGGGSGGSIHIKAQNIINNGQIMAKGGKGAQKGSGGLCSRGGDGGYGRIRIDTGSLKDIGNVKPNIGYTQK